VMTFLISVSMKRAKIVLLRRFQDEE
jgi:hypothetical protein